MQGRTAAVEGVLLMADVWTFWTGPRPPWISLCLETLSRHCPTIKVLDDSFWTSEFDANVPIQQLLESPAHFRSNLVRSWLLSKRGGIWVDADCICLRDLQPIAEKRASFTADRQSKGGLCSALVSAKPGSQIAFRWWRLTKRQAATNIRSESWDRLSLGPRLLGQAIAAVPSERVLYHPSSLVHPIHWRDHAAFVADVQPTIDPRAWCWMLTSGSLGDMRSWSRDQILESPTLIGRVFRHALGMP